MTPIMIRLVHTKAKGKEMKEYLINTDSGISFGVFGVSENEARETAEEILNQIVITSVVECQTPVI
jgi:hypothetical protein